MTIKTCRSGLGMWFAACLSLAACSSNPAPAQPPAGGTSGGETAHHGGGEGHHGPHLPPGPISEMQAVLRPLAHGELGADREARICTQAETLRQRAAAIAAAPVPSEAQPRADVWRAGTASLTR